MIIMPLGLLLLPIGIVLLPFGLKKKIIGHVGVALILLAVPAYIVMREWVVWTFDSMRDWGFEIPIKMESYEVTFVHYAGGDFYDTFVDVKNRENKTHRFWIDGDDTKWNFPSITTNDNVITIQRIDGNSSETVLVNLERESIALDTPWQKGEVLLRKLEYK